MFFMMGINQKEEEIDFSQTIICDVCGSYGRLMMFMTYSVLSLFFIPVFKWNRHYYVKTSCCHTIYEIDAEIAEKIIRKEVSVIHDEDLRIVQSGYKGGFKKCVYCDFETNEDFAYCPKCGKPF